MELELKKERFLITGGYGFIGSCLIRELINDDLILYFYLEIEYVCYHRGIDIAITHH